MDSIAQQKEDFDKYVKIIYTLAHKYSAKYKCEFDDAVDVGYEFYAWCLKNFDSSKGAKFSTYFYMQLNARMRDELRKGKKQIDVLYGDITSEKENFNFEDFIKSPDELNPNYKQDLLEDSKTYLSYEGQIVFKWLLDFEWRDKQHNPTQLLCARMTGLSKVSVKSSYFEIGHYWNNYGWKVA